MVCSRKKTGDGQEEQALPGRLPEMMKVDGAWPPVGRENPFTPGNGLDPPFLAGREREEELFRRALARAGSLPQNLVITGLRGTGKTVLLRAFARRAAAEGWLVAEREYGERFSREGRLVAALTADLSAKASGAGAGRVIREVASGVYEVEERFRTPGPREGVPPEDYLSRLLEAGCSAADASGRRGIVLIGDEFQTVRDARFPGEYPLSALISAVACCQREGLSCLLVLGGLPPLVANLVAARTYSERMFQVLRLGHLDFGESREAIVRPLGPSGRTFTPGLVEVVAAETGGYPYFIQFYCHYILETVPKQLVGLEDYLPLRDLLIWELDTGFFSARYEKASDGEKEVLRAMAVTGVSAERRAVAALLGKSVSSQALQVNLGRLEEKGLVYRERRGVYGFTLPLFRDYLLRLNRAVGAEGEYPPDLPEPVPSGRAPSGE